MKKIFGYVKFCILMLFFLILFSTYTFPYMEGYHLKYRDKNVIIFHSDNLSDSLIKDVEEKYHKRLSLNTYYDWEYNARK